GISCLTVFCFVRIGKGVAKTAKSRTCIRTPHTPIRAFAKPNKSHEDKALAGSLRKNFLFWINPNIKVA
ncbi:MAG: hypothetical protein P8O10_15785, partial [Pseudorhodobacter sp.]|nr:hypothetical protein [Pseudorhodobacter sp.]